MSLCYLSLTASVDSSVSRSLSHSLTLSLSLSLQDNKKYGVLCFGNVKKVKTKKRHSGKQKEQ